MSLRLCDMVEECECESVSMFVCIVRSIIYIFEWRPITFYSANSEGTVSTTFFVPDVHPTSKHTDVKEHRRQSINIKARS